MAYSGTTTFLMTRDDIIGAALRGLEVYGPADTIPSADITNCAQALNIILKAWGGQGLNLWTNVDRSITLTAGQAVYDVGPTATSLVTNLPLRIVDAYLRVSGVDTKIQIMSRYDYDTVANKTTQGPPNSLFYDPQLPNGKIYLAPAPSSSAAVLHFVSQDSIQDLTSSSDNPYIPQEWYQILKWALMDEISMEYGCKASVVAYAEKKAEKYRSQLSSYIKQTYGDLNSLDTPATPRSERA